MGIDYVDIFYSHRPDPETPLEETMEALSDAVRRGKALYAGISNYDDERTRRAAEILRRNGTPGASYTRPATRCSTAGPSHACCPSSNVRASA